MQTLIHNVEKLLRNHNFIALPGFGGFVATIDGSFELDGILYPPHKSIGYNPSLNYNDGVLAQAFATELNISIDDANLIISKSIEELISTLTERGHFRFGSVGIFHRTSTGVEFEPSHKESYLSSSFGLVPICFPIINPDVSNPDVKAANNKPQTIEASRRAQFTRSATWVAAVAAVILAFLMIPMNLNDGKSIYQLVQQEASFAPSVPNIGSQTSDVQQNIEQHTVEAKTTNTNNFHLILACFKTEAKARQYINEINESYKSNCTIIQAKGHCMVSLCSFNTESEGTDFLKIFVKDNRKFKDAWVYATE